MLMVCHSTDAGYAGVQSDLKFSVLLHVSEQGRLRDRGEVALRTLKPLTWTHTEYLPRDLSSLII